ncbi:class I SAM-dependent methyltransferase [Nonomuraea longicatena]|uniref:Class I SAM-dependent methyltransferase n=1 Tax=Nonomuraea longicatena TaxID=83682 RepID=A0ABN1R6C3_9ACTN
MGSPLRQLFVDGPNSVAAKARARRWHWVAQTFPDLTRMHVIDLGGTASAWLRAPIRPASVHVVNLAHDDEDLPDWLRTEVGDACELPKRILGSDYDLVFSNAVIEHVGGFARRRAFADAVHTLAGRYWVQTPYRYFPVEPHVLFPFYQFLPLNVRARINRVWPLVHTNSPDWTAALHDALDIELIGRAEMRLLFPTATMRAEKVAGLTKSLIAIKA